MGAAPCVRARWARPAGAPAARPSEPRPRDLSASGCGKTTLVNALVGRFAADGFVCADASIDDFYLPRSEQQRLADENPGNRLLQARSCLGDAQTRAPTSAE